MAAPRSTHIVSYRSGLESGLADWLRGAGIVFGYETAESVIKYTIPSRLARYTPDFVLPNGIIIETKGQFVSADRKKHLLVREEYPELDIRFVFSNANARIGKKSETRYSDWCNGKNPKHYVFKYFQAPSAFQARSRNAEWLPDDWLKEQ